MPIGFSPTASAQQAEPSAELQRLQAMTAGFYTSGAYAEAIAFAEKALVLVVAEFGAEHERTGIQTYSLGLIAEAAGRLPDAERHYRESVRIRDTVYGADSAGTAQAIEKLGGVVLRAGRAAEAEALFQRVLKIRSDLVGTQHAFTASAHADLGAVSIAQGAYSKALGHYRDAIRLLTTPRPAATLSRSVIDDDIRRNRAAFAGLAHAAWETASRPGGDRPALLAETFAASQQAWSTSAASALARMSARLGAGDTDLGRRIRRLQDMSERVLALHDEDMKALAAWSEAQRANPAFSAALAAFRQASIDRGRDTAPVISRQKALVAQLQELLKRCPPGQQPSAGCEDSGRQREAITRDLGALSASSATGSGALIALQQRLTAADQQLPGYAQFTARRTARLDESQSLDHGIGDERAAIVTAFPDYVALTEPNPLTIAETRALLAADEALVTILVGPAKSFVWAISRDRAEWAAIELGADALGAHVAALRRGLAPDAGEQSGVTAGYDLERAHTLYRLLLAPVASVLAGKQHLIVVPTGPLSSLPFQVLLTSPPRSSGTAVERLRTAPWLIRRHALSVLPSVQSLAALRRLAPATAPSKPFLGVGDPVLTGPLSPPPGATPAPARSVLATPPAAVYRNGQPDLRALRELMPLPETAYELRTIGTLLGAGSDAILLRADASETRVKRTRLEDYRVVQFATHGLVTGDLSGLDEPALVLTPPGTPSELDDGLLTASEIAGLRLSADWVVLSACNTASGSDAGADALSGLARAFFYAGARGLLVSHWAVNSQAAVGLTTQTFARLAIDPKLGRAEAFRRTMLGMIDAGQPPSYWAPFVIVGEGGAPR